MYRWLMILGLVVLTAATVGLGATNARNNGMSSGEGDAAAVLKVDGYIVSGSVYRSKIHVVESNLEYMRQSGETDMHWAEFNKAYADVIAETGPETVALGGIIADAVVYQWGIDHDLEASDEELRAAIEEQREIVATAEGSEIEKHRARIAEIGGERYWNELLPRALRHGLMVEAVRQSQYSTDQDSEANRAAWRAFRTLLILEANIQPLDTDMITDEMIEQAIDCLTVKMPALYAEYPGY